MDLICLVGEIVCIDIVEVIGFSFVIVIVIILEFLNVGLIEEIIFENKKF